MTVCVSVKRERQLLSVVYAQIVEVNMENSVYTPAVEILDMAVVSPGIVVVGGMMLTVACPEFELDLVSALADEEPSMTSVESVDVRVDTGKLAQLAGIDQR